MALREPVASDHDYCDVSIKFQRGDDLIHCLVCGQNGEKEDPLYAGRIAALTTTKEVFPIYS